MAKRYWLMKSEPNAFSFDDLMNSPDRTTCWDGVRNYQARNFMRDDMQLGDGVLYYHSRIKPMAIVGIATVVKTGYPDYTAHDPEDKHFDPKSSPEKPRWSMVDIQGIQALKTPLTLTMLRDVEALNDMPLLKKGQRLSVQPLSEGNWKNILKLGGIEAS